MKKLKEESGMENSTVLKQVDRAELDWLSSTFDRLFPICRSILGSGYRESLKILSEDVPFEWVRFPTGTQVFDWKVPEEWKIESAQLTGPDGRVYADFSKTNLAVWNYSTSVDQSLSWEELQPHLVSLPELPEAIPYVTTYYKRNWGFCVSQNVRDQMPKGQYHAKIVATHEPGELVCGQAILKGESDRQVLLSSYLCHPSMANNELSGPLCLSLLYQRLKAWPKRRYTYRFVINPETIGSISYLSRFGSELQKNLEAGIVLTCMGGSKTSLTYKPSRDTNRRIDKLFTHLAKNHPDRFRMREFSPLHGSDERQYCSPGFNFPVGQVARTPYLEYDGYHNSLDTKDYMDIHQLLKSVDELERVLYSFEYLDHYLNISPYGEPQLGRRNLYPQMNSHTHLKMSGDVQDNRKRLNHILAILSFSDGRHDLVDIAERMGWSMTEMIESVDVLMEQALLERANGRILASALHERERS